MEVFVAVEQWSERVTVARLSDDPSFSEDLDGLLAGGLTPGNDLVLDFAGIRTVNSSNISALLVLRKRMSQTGGRLVLCGVSDSIWGTFLVTSIDHLFSFERDVATALAGLAMGK